MTGRGPLTAVAVIPARIGSTRLPEKMLLSETGLPLVVHVMKRASQASRLAAVVVATDDERIRRVVEQHGGRARMTSPGHRSGSDRIGELLPELRADLVFNLQGDEPEVDPAVLDAIVARMEDDAEADVGTAAAPIKSQIDLVDTNCVKVVLDARQRALYFSRSAIPGGRGGATLDAGPLMHVGVYAYRRRAIEAFLRLPPSRLELAESLEQLRLLEAGYRFSVVVTRTASRGIDTESDYAAFVRRAKNETGEG